VRTPGPWIVKMDEKLTDAPKIAGPVKESGRRDVIALFPIMGDTDTCKDNAAFIVHACNSHDDLLVACKDLLSFEYRRGDLICQKRLIPKCMCNECVEERAKAAIQKAEVAP